MLPVFSSTLAQVGSLSFEERVDRYFSSVEDNNLGVVCLVASKGEVVLSVGCGFSDVGAREPLGASSIFNVGSVSKQFTAAAILKLVEDGSLEFGTQLGDIFAAVPEDMASITMHHLLTHSSGLSPRVGGHRYASASKDQFLEECLSSSLMWEPGKKIAYANANYILLAAIVEQVSEQPFESFLSEKLFSPIGMDDTGYKEIAGASGLARSYYYDLPDRAWKDWGVTPDHWPESPMHWYSIGKGDIHSSLDDLYKWHLALESGMVLAPEMKVKLETPYIQEDESGNSHYAYGWAIFRTPTGGKIVSHNGSNGFYFADFIRFIDDDVVVICLSNTARPDVWENMAWDVARMYFESDYEPNPIPKFSFQIVHEFIESKQSKEVAVLPEYFEEAYGAKMPGSNILNSIGMQLVRENEFELAIELLKQNIEMYPGDGNLYDSLGESYLSSGDSEMALKSFQQSLELAQSDDCHWCENASMRIAEISDH